MLLMVHCQCRTMEPIGGRGSSHTPTTLGPRSSWRRAGNGCPVTRCATPPGRSSYRRRVEHDVSSGGGRYARSCNRQVNLCSQREIRATSIVWITTSSRGLSASALIVRKGWSGGTRPSISTKVNMGTWGSWHPRIGAPPKMVCPYFIPEEPRIHREQEFFRSLLVEPIANESSWHDPTARRARCATSQTDLMGISQLRTLPTFCRHTSQDEEGRISTPREPLNNSAQAWMGRVVPFFGDVQASL